MATVIGHTCETVVSLAHDTTRRVSHSGTRLILAALKRYGMMLADNRSPWFISGVPDPGWDNDDLHALTQLTGDDFEVVDTSSLIVDPDSGQVP